MPFSEVIGHQRVIGLLARAVRRDSLPPSLIFAGPAGVGKHLVGLATAQAFNCKTPVLDPSPALELDACGTCQACRRIGRGVHADVVVLSPGETGSIKIDEVRELIDRTAYRPFEGRQRVAIIDGADALGEAAQQALLKVLEEPPASSVFLLITSRPDALLSTVRSRCPLLRFGPLDAQEIAAVLVRKGYEEAAARAAAAAGGLARALEGDGGDFVEARNSATQVLEAVGSTRDPGRRLGAAKDLLARNDRGRRERDALAAKLTAMASLLRDVEILSTRADARSLANSDVRPSLERLARTYGGARGVGAFTAVDRALLALGRNAGVKVVADWLVLQL